MTDHFAKTLIPRLGSCRALWSCTKTALWTFNPLGPTEVHYMEENTDEKPDFQFHNSVTPSDFPENTSFRPRISQGYG